MKRLTYMLCLVLVTSGCATLDPGAVRELTEHESAAFRALDKRLVENRPVMKNLAKNLGELGAEWAEREFELERNLARAKRLESMQALSDSASGNFAKTQNSVVLYHLYEVEMAQQKVLDARIAQRRAAAQEVLNAYDRYAELLGGASSNLRIVMRYLNQPKSAGFGAFTASLLGEVKAFREQLQQSDSPHLRALAEDIVRRESEVVAFKQQADRALQDFFRLQGTGN
jgi:hypothetical protein